MYKVRNSNKLKSVFRRVFGITNMHNKQFDTIPGLKTRTKNQYQRK